MSAKNTPEDGNTVDERRTDDNSPFCEVDNSNEKEILWTPEAAKRSEQDFSVPAKNNELVDANELLGDQFSSKNSCLLDLSDKIDDEEGEEKSSDFLLETCSVCKESKMAPEMSVLLHACVDLEAALCISCLLRAVQRVTRGESVMCPVKNCSCIIDSKEIKANLNEVDYLAFLHKKMKTVKCAVSWCTEVKYTNQDVGQFTCAQGHKTCISCLGSHKNILACVKIPHAYEYSMEAMNVLIDVKKDPDFGKTGAGDSYVVCCKTFDCGGWCFTTQTELGMFICPLCMHHTCFSCNQQHYPFKCEHVAELPSLTGEEWRKFAAVNIACLDKDQQQIFTLVDMYCSNSEDLEMKKLTTQEFVCLIQQREIIRSEIKSLTGADPAVFHWYWTERFKASREQSAIQCSSVLETVKITLDGDYSQIENIEVHKRGAIVTGPFLSNVGIEGYGKVFKCTVSTYLHSNAKLECDFEEQRRKLESTYPDETDKWAVTYLYHGTRRDNVQSIFENNFDVDKCVSDAYGKGIYFTTHPITAIAYSYTRGKLDGDAAYIVVCKVLRGLSQPGCRHYNRACECDSHFIKSRDYVVVKDPVNILPVYELVVTPKRNTTEREKVEEDLMDRLLIVASFIS